MVRKSGNLLTDGFLADLDFFFIIVIRKGGLVFGTFVLGSKPQLCTVAHCDTSFEIFFYFL